MCPVSGLTCPTDRSLSFSHWSLPSRVRISSFAISSAGFVQFSVAHKPSTSASKVPEISFSLRKITWQCSAILACLPSKTDLFRQIGIDKGQKPDYFIHFHDEAFALESSLASLYYALRRQVNQSPRAGRFQDATLGQLQAIPGQSRTNGRNHGIDYVCGRHRQLLARHLWPSLPAPKPSY